MQFQQQLLLHLQDVNTDGVLGIVFGCLAIGLATINVVGGYLVTDRMLGMFKKKEDKKQ